jgi:hypothetical protein
MIVYYKSNGTQSFDENNVSLPYLPETRDVKFFKKFEIGSIRFNVGDLLSPKS